MRVQAKPAAAAAAATFLLLLLLSLTWPGHGVWLLVVGIPLALAAAALWWHGRLQTPQDPYSAAHASPFEHVGAYGMTGASFGAARREVTGVPLSMLLAPVGALAILLFIGGALGSSEPTPAVSETALRDDVSAIDRSGDGEPTAPQISPQRPQQLGQTSIGAGTASASTTTTPVDAQQSESAESAGSGAVVRPIVVAAPSPASAASDEAQEDAVALPQSTNTFEYVVDEGDTLYDIAERYGTTVDALMEINGLDGFSFIHPGDVLLIPRGEEEGEES